MKLRLFVLFFLIVILLPIELFANPNTKELIFETNHAKANSRYRITNAIEKNPDLMPQIEELKINYFTITSSEIFCSISLFDGEETIIRGQYFDSPIAGIDEKIVKITNCPTSNIVSMKFNNEVIKVYVVNEQTGELNAYLGYLKESNSKIDLEKRCIGSSEAISKTSHPVSRDELIELEYEWLKYVTPQIKATTIDKDIVQPQQAVVFQDFESLHPLATNKGSTYLIEATFKDPLDPKTTTLGIIYGVGITAYKSGDVKNVNNSIHIVDQYQINSNKQRTYFKMLSLKDIGININLNPTSRSKANLVRAYSGYESTISGGIEVNYSIGISKLGGSIEFKPFKTTTIISEGALPVKAGDTEIKAFKSITKAHLQKHINDMVFLNIDFLAKSSASISGNTKTEPSIYLFGSTKLGTKSHYNGWNIP